MTTSLPDRPRLPEEALFADVPPLFSRVAWRQVLVLGGIGLAILGPIGLAILLAA